MTPQYALQKLKDFRIRTQTRFERGEIDRNEYNTLTAWLDEEIYNSKIKLKRKNHE